MGKTDVEYISEWVQKCCELEEVPILLCQQENIGCENEKFILAIMTEFQKQIFLSSSKEIICVDTINRASDYHIIVLSIMEELNTAFPVAYCITNKLNKEVLIEFFTCIKESIGNLSLKYLISSYHNNIYESWVEVMGYSPVWLWSRWSVEKVIRAHLRIFLKENAYLKSEFFKILHVILSCKSKDVCECMFKNFIHRIETDVKTEKLAHWIMKNLGINKEKWAQCYQMEINCVTNLNLEFLHETFFKCGKMFKKRGLFALIYVLMKVLRYKIIDRLLHSLDDIKLNLAVNAIDICHEKGMNILSSQICSLSNKLWKIETEDFEKVYVTQEMESCPDICNLKCKECNVCVHQFSCSCLHSMINANLCMHVHAIVFKLLGPFEVPTSIEVGLEEDSFLENGNISPLEEELCNSAQFTSDTQTSRTSISPHKPNTSTIPVTHSLEPVTFNSKSEINIQNCITTQTEPLACSEPHVIITPPSQINSQKSISTQTEPLSYPPPQVVYISPSQINGQESIATQTEISVPTPEIINNLRQSNISNSILPNFASDISTIPKVISWAPTLNSEIPQKLSTATPFLSTTTPFFNPNIPLLITGNSFLNMKTPTIDTQTSSLNTQAAILNVQIPALNTRTPTLNTQFPYLNTQTPALNIQTPFLNSQIPILNAMTHAMSAQASIWDTPTHALNKTHNLNTQIPTSNTQIPSSSTHMSALIAPVTALNTQASALNTQTVTSNRQTAASNTLTTVSNTLTTVSNTLTTVSNTLTAVTDTQTTVSKKKDTPVLRKYTPAFIEDPSVLNENISILNNDTTSAAPDRSTAKYISNPLKSILLESMNVHQSIQSSALDEGRLAGITNHLNACLNIIKNSKNESLSSPVQPTKSKIDVKYKKTKTKLHSVPNRSLKRTASSSLDINEKNKLLKNNIASSSHLK